MALKNKKSQGIQRGGTNKRENGNFFLLFFILKVCLCVRVWYVGKNI